MSHPIADIEERIREHAERVARELPKNTNQVECWSCSASTGHPHLQRRGWRVRVFWTDNGVKLKHVACPDCFARWGWGDV